ncbi:hypothetical protein [Candidatus Phyllobacterium onerii]|uniref:hypothetical protein n=1 Tax=Candidatus Phyllobacterium onerii TaxID=3020828 RepID=UPI00232C3AA9|nr:hypothetical protein [Phyllobacterium sp. IY22]
MNDLSHEPGIVHRLTTSARTLGATSRQEQQSLLREAAKQIEAYQSLLALYGSAAYEIDKDIFGRLTNYADRIDFIYLDETRSVMLEAAAVIRHLRLILGINPEASSR